ncbi:SDR family NAD(P)-dependent oxidoreductase [Nonomuraea sp. JJY05]|uniref:SDR family NAD(P)-dependent oxidoreductase n=1 Tax=Nonomuraea sp. JJY05 TaxID=3350255 RepID=UPI00373F4810
MTGASSGIGHATALELPHSGHFVYGAARRVGRMAALRDAGGRTLPMDVTEEEDLKRVVDTVLDEHRRIDVLVNNAGTVVHGAAEAPAGHQNDQATAPAVVATTIREAVESDRPETRYVVGRQAEALLRLKGPSRTASSTRASPAPSASSGSTRSAIRRNP